MLTTEEYKKKKSWYSPLNHSWNSFSRFKIIWKLKCAYRHTHIHTHTCTQSVRGWLGKQMGSTCQYPDRASMSSDVRERSYYLGSVLFFSFTFPQIHKLYWKKKEKEGCVLLNWHQVSVSNELFLEKNN